MGRSNCAAVNWKRLDADDFLLRGDLIETLKILTGIEKVDMEQFFELSDTGYNLRGQQKANSQQMSSGLQKVFL